MENVQFEVGSVDFLNSILNQAEALGIEELVGAFSKIASNASGKGEWRGRCSVKNGADGVVFSVSKSDLVSVLGAIVGHLAVDQRGKFCRKIAKCITDHRSFPSGVTGDGGVSQNEVSFNLEVATGDLTGVNFDKLDKKTLVALKKKILESMLGVTEKGAEKGRPIGAHLKCGATGIYVEMSQEQAVSLLRRTLSKLSSDQLISLDSRLGGAITSLPDNKGQ